MESQQIDKPRSGFSKVRMSVGMFLAVILASAGIGLNASASSAHVGDIHVAEQKCVDATSMTATYEVGWTNATATGKLYQRSGLYGQTGNAGSNVSGWTFVKNVSGTSGSDSFTITHAKSSFTGTNSANGPWWSSKIVFSNGYGVAADTRVENFDWNKCGTKKVTPAGFTVTPETCDTPGKLSIPAQPTGVITKVNGNVVTPPWSTSTPGSYTVAFSAASGYELTTNPSGTAVVKPKDTSKACWTKDATASVTVSPGTCYAPGSAAVSGVNKATLVGTLDQSVGTHVATFKSDTGALFGNGSDTLQVSYTVPGKDKSKCEAVSPVNPTVQQSVCVNGSPTAPTLTTPTTEGIAYVASPAGPYSPGQTVVVTATWDENHNQPANLPAGWTKTSATTATFTVTFSKPDCTVTVQPPTVPVVDECGPNNAHFGVVPSGPWTSVTNPNGSITITANPGNTFPNGPTVTIPAPVDSNVLCPTPPVVTPPVVVPPTDDNPIRLVSVNVKQRDRCGTVNDRFKVGERSLAIYTVKGKQVKPEGKWLKTKGAKRIVVKAMVDPGVDDVQLVGVTRFVLTFNNAPCKNTPPPPVHFPDTGLRFTSL